MPESPNVRRPLVRATVRRSPAAVSAGLSRALRGRDGNRLSRSAPRRPGCRRRRTQPRFWWDTARGLVVTAFREHREILFQDVDYALRMMRKDVVHLRRHRHSWTGDWCEHGGIHGCQRNSDPASALLRRQSPDSSATAQPAAGVENLLFSVKEIEDYRFAEPHPGFGGRVPRDDIQPARRPRAGAGGHRRRFGQFLPRPRCDAALRPHVHG